MKRWWRIFWKGLSSLLTPEGPSSVFFSFIQGLAIENTTEKYFIAVPLTGLSLLTCKSFVWILSGPYIFLLFDSERLDTGTMSLASLWQHESLRSGCSLQSDRFPWSSLCGQSRRVISEWFTYTSDQRLQGYGSLSCNRKHQPQGWLNLHIPWSKQLNR